MDRLKGALGGGGFAKFDDDGAGAGAAAPPSTDFSFEPPVPSPAAIAPSSAGAAPAGTPAPGDGPAPAAGATHVPAGSVKGKPAANDGKSSIPMASFNLSNAIIGAGVGGMPYALREAGFYSGIILMILVSLCSDYSVRLLIQLGKKVNKKYYEQLVASQFGKAGFVAVSGAMGIFAYGAMCAYLIGIGDTMSIVVSTWSGVSLVEKPWLKRVVLVCLAVGAVLPLALVRDMAKLSKTSFLSLMSVVFITLVVITRSITGPGNARVPVTEEEKRLTFIDTNFFPAIGIISFAFVCHHACFLVYNTLRDNTDARWAKTVHLSIGVAWGVMIVLAMAAYLTFRGVMKGNFLTNYAYDDSIVNVMRCMFAVTQTLTYPLELFVARHAVHALAFPSDKKFDNTKHYVITLLLWGSSLAIALNVADLGIVLELTGGVSAVFIGFVMPAMLHFKMTPEVNWKIWKEPAAKRWGACKLYARSYFILVFGLLAMIFTLITIGTAMATGGHGAPHDAFDGTTHNSTDAESVYDGHGSSSAHRMLL